jgi:DNA polymerase I-like protein with 3'-5' exonuclease and polymerase domains
MKLPLVPNRTTLDICLRVAGVDLKSTLESNLASLHLNTKVLLTHEELVKMVDDYKGMPFGFDVETVGANTKHLAQAVLEAQILLHRLERRAETYKKHASNYTKASKGSSYDSKIKEVLRGNCSDYKLRMVATKNLLKERSQSLKKDMGALSPFEGRVATLQFSFGTNHFLMRRELVKENLGLIESLFNNAPALGVYMHNASFEYKMMYGTFGFRIPTRVIYDSKLAELMLIRGHWAGSDENTAVRRKLTSLATCIKRRFGIDLPKGLQAGTDWELPFDHERINYAVSDAITTFSLANHQMNILKELGMMEALQIELSVLPVLAQMELRGITVDLDALNEWRGLLFKHQDSLVEQMCEIALWDTPLNVNSHVQLLHYLRTREGIDVLTTESGELEQHKHNPFVALLLQYREVTKLLSTYINVFVSKSESLGDGQGILRGSYNQCLTATGRFSSSEPNLQNIPARKRTEFIIDGQEHSFYIRDYVVPRKGYRLVGGDLSQVEIRVLAEMAGDPTLVATCNANEDTHRKVASSIFGVAIEDVTKDQRTFGKVYNLAIPYGKKAFSLSLELGITMPQASSFLNKYFNTFPYVRKFMQECVSKAEKEGVIRLPSGSIRHCQNIYSDVKWERTSAENTTYNTVIQGTSADGMKLSLIKLQELIDENGLTELAFPTLTVHDEIIVESHNSVPVEYVKDLLTTALVYGTQQFCYLTTIEVGNADVGWRAQEISCWADLK